MIRALIVLRSVTAVELLMAVMVVRHDMLGVWWLMQM